jgi:ribose 5-phosphate isomerase B
MIIYLAADHAGFELKEKIKKYLEDSGYEVKDFGAFKYEPEDDYPDFIIPAIKALNKDVKSSAFDSRAIIFGGSGQGEAIIANRFPNVQAVVCDDNKDLEAKIKAWREHANSNVLSFGARFVDENSAIKAVKFWLETPFTNEERHQRRLKKIASLAF